MAAADKPPAPPALQSEAGESFSVARARLGGLARAANTSKSAKSKHGKKMARARWKKARIQKLTITDINREIEREKRKLLKLGVDPETIGEDPGDDKEEGEGK